MGWNARLIVWIRLPWTGVSSDYVIERSKMSSLTFGGTPPDRFLRALGRVSFEMEQVDTFIDALLQTLAQIKNSDALTTLIDGENLSWKIERCRRLLEASSVFNSNEATELEGILKRVKLLTEERNRYIHSSWDRYDEESEEMYGVYARRRNRLEYSVRIKGIEEMVGRCEVEIERIVELIEAPFYELVYGK